MRIFHHTLEAAGEKIPLKVRKSRQSKRVRIIIRPGGEVTVTSPLSLSDARLFAFVESKAPWIKQKREALKEVPTHIQGSAEDFQAHREKALLLAKERLQYWNRLYHFQWQRITIRNQKTRWGSCSKQGNLSFSYKIALLPPEQSDYIIVHELCHLGEFNHSPRFWALVARALPDYQAYKQALKVSLASRLRGW